VQVVALIRVPQEQQAGPEHFADSPSRRAKVEHYKHQVLAALGQWEAQDEHAVCFVALAAAALET
jgi:hypothetical protein